MPDDNGQIKTVEKFAEHVAKVYSGELGHAESPQAVDWEALIELVMQIVLMVLGDCPASRAATAAAVKNPDRRQRALFGARVSKSCECCANQRFKNEAGKIAACMRDCASHLSEADIAAILDDAADPNYVQI
jgi:hypothetical protein